MRVLKKVMAVFCALSVSAVMITPSLNILGSVGAFADEVQLTNSEDDPSGEQRSGTCGENLTWKLENNTLTISGSGEMENYDDYNDVKPAPWKPLCNEIVSVIIEDDVTSIGDYAFYGCESLTYATIPNTVVRIGNYAFCACHALTSVTIPNSVESIGNDAFFGCYILTAVTIPESVKSIGDSVFESCQGLKSVEIRMGITSIGERAFCGCTHLESVTIPDSVISIGNEAFIYCESLKSVTISDSVTSIGEAAFHGCTSLMSVTIPNSVTNIGDSVFYNCTGLVSVSIPESITSISKNAFYDCTSLASVTILDSVTSIGEAAFHGCSSLTSVTIPDSVTNIGGSAFYNCTGLISVSIPDSVINIGTLAFENCESLISVKIPNKIQVINLSTFENCANLMSVTMPNSITNIGNSAFDNCSKLKDVYYSGTETEWEKISIGAKNEALTKASVYYNSKPFCFVNFIAEEGTVSTSYAKTDTNGKLGELPEAVRDNYTFDGWFTSADGGEKITTDTVFTADTTVYAHWTKNDVPPEEEKTFAVTFNANGGTASVTELTTDTNGKLGKLPEAVRNNYTFDGWFTSANGSEKITADTIFTADTTVYAHWTKNDVPPEEEKTFAVTFNANGGTASVTELTTDTNGKLGELPEAVRDNYTFDGWFMSANGGEKITADTVFTADTTIYAHWNEGSVPAPESYTVTIPENVTVTLGGSAIKNGDEIKEGDVITVTANVPSGYKLNSLTVNGESISNGSTYTVGKGNAVISVNFEFSPTVIPRPTPSHTSNSMPYNRDTTENTVEISEVNSDIDNNTGKDANDTREEGIPFIPNSDKKGWDGVLEIVNSSPEGNVTVNMNGNTVLPDTILRAAKENNVKLTLMIDNTFSWSIDGRNIKGTDRNIDMKVAANAGGIPNDAVKKLVDEREHLTLSLKHSGEFGFNALLVIGVGTEYDNQTASLYWYDNGEFKPEDTCKVQYGKAVLEFTHASDWIVVFGVNDNSSESIAETSSENVSETSANSSVTNSNGESTNNSQITVNVTNAAQTNDPDNINQSTSELVESEHSNAAPENTSQSTMTSPTTSNSAASNDNANPYTGSKIPIASYIILLSSAAVCVYTYKPKNSSLRDSDEK